MIDVSIIIVNYNSAELIIDCVHSIYERTKDIEFEIIVVDNASEYDSVKKLNSVLGTKICLVESDVNLGFGKANNLGAQSANGEYLFLLNPDTVLMNDAVSVLCKYLEQHPEVGIVGGNLYTRGGLPNPSFCTHFDELASERKNASWGHIIKNKIQNKKNQKKENTLTEFNYTEIPQNVAYIFGADMMIKKSVFDELGGFDPDFFMYAEEEELTWRVTKAGYSVLSIPQAKIIHLEGGTTSEQNSFSECQFRMRMNGTMIYYMKRFGWDGVHKFYRYRKKRYARLSKLSKIQGKPAEESFPYTLGKLLDEEYNRFVKEKEL